MFGYVIADLSRLDEVQAVRYRSCYCGLCRTLKSEYGFLSRMSLSYDMAFLTLLLQSLYEPSEQSGCLRCLPHPCKKHPYCTSDISRYAAAMNTALAYYNCLDDWHDERRLGRLLFSLFLRRSVKKATAQYPEQLTAIENGLAKLSEIESSKDALFDDAATAFGEILGALFVCRDDRWAQTLRNFGTALGKFIYMMDAVCDLESDRKHGRRNLLLPLLPDGENPTCFRPHLKLLIADACEEFEKLPLVQDAALLRNILYSGVWGCYDAQFHPKEKEANRS
ncbi:MAG: hypothetical protein IIY04_02690 [Oscillospiraceae bacterium]|nr:hypothetical protein [Oscillospiraceae bacterium]